MTLDELKERLAAIDEEIASIIADLEPSEEEPADEERKSTEELEKRSAELMEERTNIVAEIEKAEAKIAEEKRAMEEVITNKNTKVIDEKEKTTMTNMEIRRLTWKSEIQQNTLMRLLNTSRQAMMQNAEAFLQKT